VRRKAEVQHQIERFINAAAEHVCSLSFVCCVHAACRRLVVPQAPTVLLFAAFFRRKWLQVRDM